MNTYKMEYMSFKQEVAIPTQNDEPLKLAEKFTTLTAAFHLLKIMSVHAAVELVLLYGCTTGTLTERKKKALDGNSARILRAILNKI